MLPLSMLSDPTWCFSRVLAGIKPEKRDVSRRERGNLHVQHTSPDEVS